MIYLFLAPGFEEIEALATVDVLRRCGLQVVMTAVSDELCVAGAHGMGVTADANINEIAPTAADALVLPGGMPGSLNLMQCHRLRDLLISHAGEQGVTAAICAAPLVLGHLGLLVGRKATCYPGVEPELTGATCTGAMVEVDGNIITGKGPAAAFEFGYTLVEQLKSPEATLLLRDGMLYSQLLP